MKIANEKEYRNTKAWLRRFQQDVERLKVIPKETQTPLQHAQLAAVNSQIEDLEQQLQAYEVLRQEQLAPISTTGISALPELLIQARLASGLTQEQLGQQLKLRKQQVQRYEASRYQSASLERLGQVAAALGVRFKIEKS
jgi:ribosome-binding protein aMBF1 (putative translation factor)